MEPPSNRSFPYWDWGAVSCGRTMGIGGPGSQGGLLGVHCDAVGDLQGTHP